MTDCDYDLVIRNGTIVDGSGGAPFAGDLAIRDGVIVAIGTVPRRGGEEIAADGCIVTPGFVDIHTHYDGQITWEQRLAPSSGHGVTTVVMGNCGVGFAPARADQHDLLMRMMEGVEDIPQAVMAEGVPWNWETFPEYLDALAQRHADIDFAAQLPHNPLRIYVMGQRGADNEAPTADDLVRMRALTAEAIRAGALGVSTTRNSAHRYRDGRSVPTVLSAADEVLALAAGLRDAGDGVFEMLGDDRLDPERQIAFLRKIAETSGRPVSFTLTQHSHHPDTWLELIAGLETANRDGLTIRGQALPRPIGILLGLDLTLNPFGFHPAFRAIEHLPLADKVAAMRDPALRKRLLAERSEDPNPFFKSLVDDIEWLFPLGDPPDYHPDKDASIAARARRAGRDPHEVIYDELLRDDGRAVLYRPSANREGERFEAAGMRVFAHPDILLGLGDGGAHYGMICDAGLPTYVLLHWVMHADPGKRIALPQAIRMLASDTARAVGLGDRGRLAPGFKADVNVIDLARLHLHAPRPVHDLPAGGRRLIQQADGYVATIVSGRVTYRDGVATGALPGRLVRGARTAGGVASGGRTIGGQGCGHRAGVIAPTMPERRERMATPPQPCLTRVL